MGAQCAPGWKTSFVLQMTVSACAPTQYMHWPKSQLDHTQVLLYCRTKSQCSCWLVPYSGYGVCMRTGIHGIEGRDDWPTSPSAASQLEEGASHFEQAHLDSAISAQTPFIRLRLMSQPAQGPDAAQGSREADGEAANQPGTDAGLPSALVGEGAGLEQGGSDAGGGFSGKRWWDPGGGPSDEAGSPGGRLPRAALGVWMEPVALALRPACLLRLSALAEGLPVTLQQTRGALDLRAANRLPSRGARTDAKARLVLRGGGPLAVHLRVRPATHHIL